MSQLNQENSMTSSTSNCPVQWESLIKACGDEEIAAEIAATVVADSPQTVIDLKKAFQDNDFEKVKLFAHKLKGTALAVGAIQLAEESLQLEMAGGKEQTDIARLMDAVCSDTERLNEFISRDDWLEIAKASGG